MVHERGPTGIQPEEKRAKEGFHEKNRLISFLPLGHLLHLFKLGQSQEYFVLVGGNQPVVEAN